MTTSTTEALPFRLFEVELVRRTVLSPNFVRFTFSGADLDRFADNGYDQRIKLLFPITGSSVASLVESQADWYTAWRELPDDERPPMRTYTIRAVRPASREIDVDIVLHGLTGVATAWGSTAPLGSTLVICGPNADFDGPHGGIDFHLPPTAARVLVAGDETALPAIANIIEKLPADARGCVLVEVPDAGDAAALPAHPGLEVIVVGRDHGAHGEALQPLVHEHAGRLLAEHEAEASVAAAAAAAAAAADSVSVDELDALDVDHDLLWEVPEADQGATAAVPLYAWLAGEAGTIKALRRHLVAERGIDRKAVAFMGYWRHGRVEQN
ncbi:siderophore-interacting protein [Herbiconiux moechotypicola]|uniref:FAD-binding FR-type domain-containing protein n=1 Tax=Herbiconiux moechotypicola TaxID=637393 RepID=A0ABN3DID8_9MICO|nr:siderophore-interacting protein [Herbiconiux moechotypicola]MCS5729733.1 siderophore-interacting protein [Herbiconiux moechotypicola]